MSGVVEFLWSLNSTVALPISVAVGLSLFFRVCTTVMPTIQALLLFLPRLPCGNMPRSPCPYRSPQSWVFYQLVRPLVAIFLSIYDEVNIDKPIPSLGHRGLLSSSMILEKDRDLGYYTETTSRRRRRPINLIFRSSQGNGWAKFGVAWLYQRDLDFMGQNPRYTKNSNINEKFDQSPSTTQSRPLSARAGMVLPGIIYLPTIVFRLWCNATNRMVPTCGICPIWQIIRIWMMTEPRLYPSMP